MITNVFAADAVTQTIPVAYGTVVPELLLAGGALILLLASSVVRERMQVSTAAFIAILTALGALASTYFVWSDLDAGSPYSAIGGAIANDRFSLFFVTVLTSALVLSILISTDWLEARGQRGVEYFVLMLISTVGAVLMAAANDLIVVFLGLEILSISLYVLVANPGGNEDDLRPREAAMKYFILGGFSSAIFLYGIALTYGAVGSTNLTKIATFLAGNTLLDNSLLLAGVALLAVGFAFKIAAVPFHQWTPDVYQGAPTPVVAFMAAVSKAAAFAALLRVFSATFSTLRFDWQSLVLGLAVITLLVGSVVACVQQNVKRMLAYSSISHAGFILLGLQAGNQDGVSSSLFYLLAYAFLVTGSFAVVALVGDQNDSRSGIESYRGMWSRNPVLAMAFAVLLLAQAGVPLTSGFLAKFYVISALVQERSYAVAVFAMITAAIAAFIYLRLVVVMFSRDEGARPVDHSTDIAVPFATGLSIAIAVGFTVLFGVAPDGKYMIDAVEYARKAAADLFVTS